jgi:hypothetical protein
MQRQSENLEYEADQGVRSYNHEIEDQPKTKRYSYNEKGEIIDVHKLLIVPGIKV